MISLREVSKFYYTKTSVVLGLRRINLELEKGEFVAITGESGSGKSTLLNVISGMDTYEGGEMRVDGEETSLYGPQEWEEYRRNKISFVYQSYQLIDSYTALENVISVIMICQNGEFDRRAAKEKAMQCLEQVGLEKQAHQKASHMSSGQKQRLGIARALAKDTDIIVADEPTGNLDSENGEQVMRILYELSKDKLVIVVTHNYEQAAPFATRRIRLHNGDLVEDTRITANRQDRETARQTERRTEQMIKEEKGTEQEDAEQRENRGNEFKVARQFVRMNRLAQPHRTLFLFILMLVSAFAVFIFMGNFVANLDSTIAKRVSQQIVKNVDFTRLIVRRIDGKAIPEETLSQIGEISHVALVEPGDNGSDINYYWKPETDYSARFEFSDNRAGSKRMDITFLKDDQYIKSSGALTKEDLKAGRLPEAENEIVCYSEDESILGTTIPVYFSSKLQWTSMQWAHRDLVVVGLLKQADEQVYFSPELYRTFGVKYGTSDFVVEYHKYTDVKKGTAEDSYVSDLPISLNAKVIYDSSLGDNEISISFQHFLNLENREFEGGNVSEYFSREAVIRYQGMDGENVTEKEMTVSLKEEGNQNSRNMISAGKGVYEELTAAVRDNQSTVYITDYAYTDEVLGQLAELGCEGISAARVSATGYDYEKLQDQMTTLGISAGALAVSIILFLIVLHAVMKLKRNDFDIFRALGMRRNMLAQINRWDLITGMLTAGVVVLLIVWILNLQQQAQIIRIVHYLRWVHYAAFLLIAGAMGWAAGILFNRYLLSAKKKKNHVFSKEK